MDRGPGHSDQSDVAVGGSAYGRSHPGPNVSDADLQAIQAIAELIPNLPQQPPHSALTKAEATNNAAAAMATASAFVTQTSGVHRGSVGQDKKPTLGHKQSCRTCRKRKMRCDAGRPRCNTCNRSQAAADSSGHQSPIPPGDCVYDPPRDQNASKRKSKPRTTSNAAHAPSPASGSSHDNIMSVSHMSPSTQTEPPMAMKRKRGESPSSQSPHTMMTMPPTRLPPSDPFAAMIADSGMPMPMHYHHPTPGSTSTQSEAALVEALRERIFELEAQVAASAALNHQHTFNTTAQHQQQHHHQQQQQQQQQQQEGQQISSNSSARRVSSMSGLGQLASVAINNFGAPSAPGSVVDSIERYSEKGSIPAAISLRSFSSELPPPEVMHHLCHLFFTKHPLRSMIYEPDFQASLILPMQHPNRVAVALLHAIMAAATPFSPFAADIERNTVYTRHEETNTFLPSFAGIGQTKRYSRLPRRAGIHFGEYHMGRARAHLELEMLTGKEPIDSLQALILILYVVWGEVRWQEFYTLSSTASRLVAPQGLNNLKSRKEPDLPPSIPRTRQRNLLAPPKTAIEEHERRMTFWHVFMLDFYSVAGMQYPKQMHEEDITANLPSLLEDFHLGLDPDVNPQKLDSPDLFTVPPIDPFNLHLKAVILFSRVQTFLARIDQTILEPGHDPLTFSRFRELDEDLQNFQASWTPDFQDILSRDASGMISSDLWAGHVCTFLAVIKLHQPFAYRGCNELSNRRIAAAVSKVMAFVHLTANSTCDLMYAHHITLHALVTTGRVISAELRYVDQPELREQLWSDLSLLIDVMAKWGEKLPLATWGAKTVRHFQNNALRLQGPSTTWPLQRLYTEPGRLADANDFTEHDDIAARGELRVQAYVDHETYPMPAKRQRSGPADWFS